MSQEHRMPVAAERALEAHVQWLLARSEGEALDQWLVESLDDVLAHANSLCLGDVVNAEQISETALRYAADLPMTGGIPELVGDVARHLLVMPELEGVRLADMLPDRAMRSLIGKAAEMRDLRQALAQELQASEAFRDFLAEVLYQGVHSLLRSMPLGQRFGLQTTLDRLLAPRMEGLAARLSHSAAELLSVVDDETLQSAIERLWETLAELPLDPLRDGLSADDIDDFAALAYAVWQEERGRGLYRRLIRRGIDAVFARYGEVSLAALLADLGINRDMLLTEARQYAGPVLAVLREQGILEALIRKQLTPFYCSPELAAAIAPQGVD